MLYPQGTYFKISIAFSKDTGKNKYETATDRLADQLKTSQKEPIIVLSNRNIILRTSFGMH